MNAEPCLAQRIEREIAGFVELAQARVLAAAERLVQAHLAPVDPDEAAVFLAELRRGDV